MLSAATLAARAGTMPREARDTLFLLAVIGWLVLPHVGHLPVWCALLTAGVLLWRGWLALGSRPLPNRWWMLGLVTAAMAGTWFTHRTLLGRDAGVTLIVVLLALKTLELRARRDAFVVFFLGFFTMLTNFFFSQSLAVAAAMLLGLLGLLTALVNAHLPVGRPPLSEAAGVAARMALLGAPVMAVLFVLFPRFAPLWGIPGDALSGRSGLSSSMEVGAIATLALDEGIAMRIRWEGKPPPQDQMYFRGPVLSSFDGRQWRPLDARVAARVPAHFGNAQLRVSGEPVRYQVTLEPNNRPWLLVLDAAAAPPVAPGLEPTMTPELQWIASRPVTDLVRYRVESHTRFEHGPTAMAGVLPHYLDLPPGFDPRTHALAAELMRGRAADKPALVEAALQRLRTGGYTYTLEPGTYGLHTADEFWFDRKRGFCEHIASSFVILMRAMNIPARVVTGYQGGELNGVDGFWTLRHADAHAWAEVWLAGRGWVRVDPTSAVQPGRVGGFQRLQAPAGVFATALGTVDPNLAAQLRAAWEALNNSWNQWVLNYTQSKQLDLLRNLGFSAPGWEDLTYLLLGLLISGALLGALWSWWDKTQHDPWLRLLARVRRRLSQAGLDLPPSTPPRKMADALTARFGPDATPLAQWLIRLDMLRYSATPPTTLAALRRELRRLPWPQ
jgi:transglutaminase-like putative cysteine protease